MRRPSPATAISIVALVVALGGTSYAAITVTGRNVANGTLRSVDVKNNTLRSIDVRNRSLRGVDFRLGELPAGARGPAGAPGAAGPQGTPGAAGPAGPPGPTASAFAAEDEVNEDVLDAEIVHSATITTTTRSRIMGTATVQAQGDGGNDDNGYCFLAQGTTDPTDFTGDLGSRISFDIPAGVNDTVPSTAAGARVLDAGTYQVDLWCGQNSGSVRITKADLLVWAAAV